MSTPARALSPTEPARSNVPMRAFQIAMLAGFAVNLVFIYRAFFDPAAILTPLALPPSAANIWLGNTANLMLTINIFYIPVIIDPARYPAYSWWAALMRFTGVLFWLYAMQTNPHFLSYLLADLALGVVQSSLLFFALSQRPVVASSN